MKRAGQSTGTRPSPQARRRRQRLVKLAILVAVLLGLYLSVCLWVFVTQDQLVFRGASLPRVGVAALRTSDRVRLEWLSCAESRRFRVAIAEPDTPPRGVLVYFLGNGEDLRSGTRWAQAFSGFGLITIVAEYPGYGDSDGAPSVPAFFAVARRAAEFASATAKRTGAPLFVGGHSLGSFCALHVAARGFGTRMLLAAPPTSMVALARRQYPLLPIDWILSHRFDNLASAAEVRIPTLILHGDADAVVPWQMGKHLAQAIAGARFVKAKGKGHGVYGFFHPRAFEDEIVRLLFE